MKPSILDQIDAQSARTLRQMLISRAFEIHHLYPIPNAERATRFADLTHLVYELGMDADDVLRGCPTV